MKRKGLQNHPWKVPPEEKEECLYNKRIFTHNKCLDEATILTNGEIKPIGRPDIFPWRLISLEDLGATKLVDKEK